jgi:hypothetical protein
VPGLEHRPVGPGELFGGGAPDADLIGAAVDYLGMDASDFREAVRDGRSLAELARDKGKSVDGLREALRDAIRKDADQALEDGVLTWEQANRLVEKLGAAVDELVEGSLRDGFDFKFGSAGRSFGLHLRVAPEGGTPPGGPGQSLLAPTIVP